MKIEGYEEDDETSENSEKNIYLGGVGTTPQMGWYTHPFAVL